MPGSVKGILVGAANALLIAFFIALHIAPNDVYEATMVIGMIAGVPAGIVGAFVGHVAERAQVTNRRSLLVFIVVVSCIAVSTLGTLFELQEMILVSCIPTAAACSILERWTRPSPHDGVPVARLA